MTILRLWLLSVVIFHNSKDLLSYRRLSTKVLTLIWLIYFYPRLLIDHMRKRCWCLFLVIFASMCRFILVQGIGKTKFLEFYHVRQIVLLYFMMPHVKNMELNVLSVRMTSDRYYMSFSNGCLITDGLIIEFSE